MKISSTRVLIVEDYEPFRRTVVSLLEQQPELLVIGEVSDGLEAVRKAQELQPELVLLDIGLPTLNGIEVARQVRKLSIESKILFLSQESSADIVQAALATGAKGYVVKTDVRRDLLMAVNAVLRGDQFVGRRFSDNGFTEASDAGTSESLRSKSVFGPLQQRMEIVRRHEVGFHSDDASLLDNIAQFIGTALKTGNPAIAVATESHRNSLLPRLQAYGVDTSAAMEQGRYVALDAGDALLTFMIDGTVDRVRFMETFGHLIVTAIKAANRKHPRVAVFGECAHLLWAQGNAEAAIHVEKLGNQLAKTYDVDILCGYSLGSVQGGMDSQFFQRICAEHSAIYSKSRELSR